MGSMIDARLNVKLNDLIGKSNDLNRLADRIMSLLSNKWFMKNTSKALHPRVAHYYSLVFSDMIGEYQDLRGALTEYPGTEDSIGRSDFDKPYDALLELLNRTLVLESDVGDAAEYAEEIKDYATYQFLLNALESLVKVEDQLAVLSDILFVTGNEAAGWMALDYNIDKYISVPIAGA